MVPSRAKAPEQSGALLLRMRVRIVRTATRLCAFQDVSLAVDIGHPRLSVTPLNSHHTALADVRFAAHYGLKSDIALSPKSAKIETHAPHQLAILFNHLVGAANLQGEDAATAGIFSLGFFHAIFSRGCNALRPRPSQPALRRPSTQWA